MILKHRLENKISQIQPVIFHNIRQKNAFLKTGIYCVIKYFIVFISLTLYYIPMLSSTNDIFEAETLFCIFTITVHASKPLNMVIT